MPRRYEVPLPLGPRMSMPSKTVVSASIAALSWAAERAGQSYGQFTFNLTAAQQAEIQEQYDQYQAEQAALKAQRMAEKARLREEARAAEAGAEGDAPGILTDSDL